MECLQCKIDTKIYANSICRKCYDKNLYQKHRQQVLEYHRNRYPARKEIILARNKKYQDKHKEEIKKYFCNLENSVIAFIHT